MDCGLSDDTMASFIGSTILLDAYPSKMYRECYTSNLKLRADSGFRLQSEDGIRCHLPPFVPQVPY